MVIGMGWWPFGPPAHLPFGRNKAAKEAATKRHSTDWKLVYSKSLLTVSIRRKKDTSLYLW